MTEEEDKGELWSNEHVIDKTYVAKGTIQLYFTDTVFCVYQWDKNESERHV